MFVAPLLSLSDGFESTWSESSDDGDDAHGEPHRGFAFAQTGRQASLLREHYADDDVDEGDTYVGLVDSRTDAQRRQHEKERQKVGRRLRVRAWLTACVGGAQRHERHRHHDHAHHQQHRRQQQHEHHHHRHDDVDSAHSATSDDESSGHEYVSDDDFED